MRKAIMETKRTYYYSKAQNEDFEPSPKKVKHIRGGYVYVSTGLFPRLGAFIVYRLIATPIAFIYARLIKRVTFVNRSVLKPYLKRGYFIYANHTQTIGDALTPNIVLFPKRNYTVVSPDNVSLPVLGNITKLLGALPLPEDLIATKKFFKAIDTRIDQGYSVLIYPEAHVWPYYTQIRDFSDGSFKYPIKHHTPTFSFTTTYQKRKRHGFKIVIYVDGPFFAPLEMNPKEQQVNLHAQVMNAMKERAKTSNFEKFNYVLKEQL